jgi:hypothetical protein
MTFQNSYLPPSLSSEIGRWLLQNRSWSLRTEATSNDQSVGYFYASSPYYRYATAHEVAAEIVGSPVLREALGFLTSRDGQAIEEAVARLWLPSWQAALLTEALTIAWKTVLNQNRPAWQRAEVLIGAIALLGLLGFLLTTGRK